MSLSPRRVPLLALALGVLTVPLSGCVVGPGYDGYGGEYYDTAGGDYGAWGGGYRVGPYRDGGGRGFGRPVPGIPAGGRGGGGFHGGGGGFHGGGGGGHGGGGGGHGR